MRFGYCACSRSRAVGSRGIGRQTALPFCSAISSVSSDKCPRELSLRALGRLLLHKVGQIDRPEGEEVRPEIGNFAAAWMVLDRVMVERLLRREV